MVRNKSNIKATNIMTLKAGLLDTNTLFVNAEEKAEGEFKKEALKLDPDCDIENVLNDGYIEVDGNEVILSSPSIVV